MIRRPPRSTRTDTLLPYTTLFRSGELQGGSHEVLRGEVALAGDGDRLGHGEARVEERVLEGAAQAATSLLVRRPVGDVVAPQAHPAGVDLEEARDAVHRSEERRVGKECVGPCRYRWSPFH